MAIKMLAKFKTFGAGEIVNPEAELTYWLINRQYAVPVEEAAPVKAVKAAPAPEVAPEPPAAKKGKK